MKHLVLILALVATPTFADDAMPKSSVAFFNLKECPSGWQPFAQADGRLVASLMPGGNNGSIVGRALSDKENRTHNHTFSTTIKTDSTNYVLISGCCNKNTSESGKYPVSGTTDNASSGLPYVQLLACQKTDSAVGTTPVDSHLLTYSSNQTCPEGYSQPKLTLGRFLIGLPTNGAAGISFGGDPLQPQVESQHSHPYSGTVKLKSTTVAGAKGCCAGGYAAAKTYSYNGITAAQSVGLPYIQLLQCEKN